MPFWFSPGGASEMVFIVASARDVTGATTTHTFTLDCGIGGDVAVTLACIGVSGISISTVTIGGVSATVNVQVNTGGTNVPIGIASARGCPSGTQNIVVTTSGNNTVWICFVYNMIGVNSLTPFATGSDAHSGGGDSGTLSNPAGGCVVGITQCTNGGSPVTWTGITKDAEVGLTVTFTGSASQNFSDPNAALAWSTSFGGSNNQTAAAWASWGP